MTFLPRVLVGYAQISSIPLSRVLTERNEGSKEGGTPELVQGVVCLL